MAEPFIGEIRIMGFTFAPRDWAFCDGQLQSISQNSALFAVLGTSFGGDGLTTFGLPDFRGRFPIHAGTGAGLTTVALGEFTGSATTSLTTSNLPAHTHALNATSAAPTTHDPSGALLATLPRSGPPIYAATAAATALASSSVQSQGGGVSLTTLPPLLALNFVIALAGLPPS